MDDTRRSRLRLGLFFAVTGLVFAVCGYLIITKSPKTQAEWERRVREAPKSWFGPTPFPVPDGLLLTKDRAMPVGHAVITFRGMMRDRIFLDVCIPALDPAFAYRRDITVQEAKSGFRMAENEFRLVSARTAKLHLKTKTMKF